MTFNDAIQRVGLTRLADLIEPFARADGPPPQTLMRFILWALRGAYPLLIFAAGVSILNGLMEILSAFLLGHVIDTALENGPEGLFSTHFWLFIGCGVFLVIIRPAIAGGMSSLQSIAIGPNLNPLILSRLHRWTMGQAVTFFDNDFAGRIAQKQMQVSRAITDITVDGINTLIFALASVVSAAVFLSAIDWRIALILFIWIAVYLRFITFFMPRIRKRSAARAGARAEVSGQVVDTISNMRTVKLFAHSEFEDQAAIGAMKSFRKRALEFGYISSTFRFLLIVLAGILPLTVVGTTLYLWTIGEASTGQIAATGTVTLRISQMTGWVSFSLMGMYSHIGEIENGMKTLTPPHALTDASGAVDMARPKGQITFDDVSFAYGRQAGGVEGINLTINPGEKLGIVGASGAGKSTLVSCLLRLYDTENGAILIDGTDIRNVTQESLRRQIAMVTQETAMFNRTARDNILYGAPDATEEEVIRAAKQAEAHDFILGLEDFKGNTGYDAFLGERGVKLSGGQRQRIALARAFLKNAPILVLDEATSALDSEVEASIQEALTRVMVGKTVLAIAHRLSTISQMDRIVVLDDGRIVEQGTHSELLAHGGLYARYWERQSGGFIGAEEAAE
ncbi:ABC transporter ATP-binding protein [Actibacterium lipolyticum]|uniref:Putative multidrug export ATP-binding/permease protein n=1 Tax=Actibacterium lipolyticum TaxID=1524263 RepID=A0A238KWP4_9RHOB|nr:ABC transporter ATP-binding protein [Actibacterium lipolyticum]SMX47011.1 Putative multidrug export ATP-binding/permease protein [Actibacterium lipolyticum]